QEPAEELSSETTSAIVPEVAPQGRQDTEQVTPRHGSHPAAGVKQAIEEVNHIIETLREALDEMEEVLETLELAERQKDADEREVESLRHALRNLQRAREGSRNPS